MNLQPIPSIEYQIRAMLWELPKPYTLSSTEITELSHVTLEERSQLADSVETILHSLLPRHLVTWSNVLSVLRQLFVVSTESATYHTLPIQTCPWNLSRPLRCPQRQRRYGESLVEYRLTTTLRAARCKHVPEHDLQSIRHLTLETRRWAFDAVTLICSDLQEHVQIWTEILGHLQGAPTLALAKTT